ncbi:aminotransferase class III-fold pyridoxal phosphate-dependent enzyme [Paenibacillus sp. CC-CFT747]|nr:aminotransferase class III-fold pyridoxal phosphate-dependent enzyme [Paenibacillus sp. CC-CFT747]
MTIGKALGGGIAISAVAGRREILNLIEEGTVSHLGTLNGNGVATSAALATIDELSKDGGRCIPGWSRRRTSSSKEYGLCSPSTGFRESLTRPVPSST